GVASDHPLARRCRQAGEGRGDGARARPPTARGRWEERGGARPRRWLAKGETPIALIESAVSGALAEAAIDKREVDLFIYAGLGKGFMEPSYSSSRRQLMRLDSDWSSDVFSSYLGRPRPPAGRKPR